MGMKAVYKVPKHWVAIPVPEDVLMEAYGALAPLLARSRHTQSTQRPLDLPRQRYQARTKPPKLVYCSHCNHSPKSHQQGACDVCGDRDRGAGANYSGRCPGWNGVPGAVGEFIPRTVRGTE